LITIGSRCNWVVSANTTDTFKARLDKFWHNQDIVYDFRAQLREPEVGVKFCINNFTKLVYCKVFL